MLIKVKNCTKYKENFSVEVEYIDAFSTKIYPDGKGGQLGDRGVINGIKILEVKTDKIIIENSIIDGIYEYEIDMNRRKDIATQHTAEHLFAGIMYSDYNFNTVGFQMGEDKTTLDFDFDNFTDELVEEIEKKVNLAIAKGAKVLSSIVPKEEIEEKEELRKKISPKITDKDIRVIKIEGYDICACSGFHLDDIKDIRIFKIISYKKIKGKYTRFTFLAGDRAIKDYDVKMKIVKELNEMFSSRDFELVERIDKNRKKLKELKKEYNNLLREQSKEEKND